ncbi:MAG: bifunctional phosphopantothenoylcysteine decarboxylase/phosphopantothenate--cysteine ligase CoaBC [Muribaculaceae bacterium]|nr:bifunctional phosphopantothenoylcysteine decarboxylase/phosphopantothenate--cysteine ligase CoaBC [Roseburia sp.]MCM1432228.1 bifunctional phosphopantothenoylcysteine decarboxylase/phosphopantothenate--cysteine ligase CoaBC [Muribaculaceae bacterium]MCM1491995.1 bifunctional phosphopantothenoylcysteine decarboxylase/phosphopantothenate--cysteine ligase CoaBC [Muribaculaceae bacterium]
MLKGKCVVLGVTGSIAAYKTAGLASALKKLHADVEVIMTKNATNFINPVTFESLTGNKCLVDTFDRNFQFQVEHVSLAKKADFFLVAPASANVIGKLAHGIADDMLTTTILACRCPKLLSPAMNTNMYENPVVQDNIKILKNYGFTVIDPASGRLACGDSGPGKMPEPEVLLDYILREIACEKDMEGLNVLVTAGPTQEKIDPVRYITNHSTGKMGYAIAENCMRRGAAVTLVTGPVAIAPPPFVRLLPVVSAADMAAAVKAEWEQADIVVMAAAVADYRPAEPAEEKIKKSEGEAVLRLERTEDILGGMGAGRTSNVPFLCGFSMETENMLENSRHKLEKKQIDMIVANNLKTAGAGFATDTNVVTILTAEGAGELPLMSKAKVAAAVVDEILAGRNKER